MLQGMMLVVILVKIFLLNAQPLPAKSTFVWGDKFVFYGGDALKFYAGSAGDIDITVSYVVQDWS